MRRRITFPTRTAMTTPPTEKRTACATEGCKNTNQHRQQSKSNPPPTPQQHLYPFPGEETAVKKTQMTVQVSPCRDLFQVSNNGGDAALVKTPQKIVIERTADVSISTGDAPENGQLPTL